MNDRMNSYLKSKIPNMTEYFPLRDSNSVERFLDNSDGLFNLRRSEFENMLIPCIHEKKNLFGTAVLKAFFSNEFIQTHSWPTQK